MTVHDFTGDYVYAEGAGSGQHLGRGSWPGRRVPPRPVPHAADGHHVRGRRWPARLDDLVHRELSGRRASSGAGIPAGPCSPGWLVPAAVDANQPGDPAPGQGGPRPAVTCRHVPDGEERTVVETPPYGGGCSAGP